MTSHRVHSARRRIAVVAMAAALLAGPVACRSDGTAQDKLAALRSEEQRIVTKLSALVKRRDHLDARIEAYKRRLAELQQRCQALEQKIARRTPHVIRPGQEK